MAEYAIIETLDNEPNAIVVAFSEDEKVIERVYRLLEQIVRELYGYTEELSPAKREKLNKIDRELNDMQIGINWRNYSPGFNDEYSPEITSLRIVKLEYYNWAFASKKKCVEDILDDVSKYGGSYVAVKPAR